MKRFLIVILSLFSIAGTSFAGDTTITDGNLVFDYETPPGAPDATIQTGDYNFSGDYWYRVTFFDGTKETEMGTATSPLEDLDTDRVELTNIPTSGSLNRKIYRTKGNAYTKTAPFYYIATLDDEDTSYIDDTPDGSLNTLGPVINIEFCPSIRKLNNPAVSAFIILLEINSCNVHGSDFLRLKANPIPLYVDGG